MKALTHLALGVTLFAVLIPVNAGASWFGRPLREFVTESDDVVIATLQNVRTSVHSGYELSSGDLTVERALCGAEKAGTTLVLRWRTRVDSGTGLKSTNALELQKYEGQPRLWLLSRDPDGSVHADHPSRVMPVDEAETVLDTLAAYPYRVIAPDRDPGEPATVTILFRNTTRPPLAIPGFRMDGALVTHGDGFALVTYRGELVYPAVRPDPAPAIQLDFDATLRHDTSIRAEMLAPGKTKRIEIPFSDAYNELPPRAYDFTIHVNGRRTNHRFIVRTDWTARLNRVRDTPSESEFYVQTLRERRPESSFAALSLRMQGSGATAVAPELMRLCDSLETDVRREIIALVPKMDLDAETRLEFLLERIDDPEPSVRKAAWSGVCQILGNQAVQYRRDEVVARLMTQLEDPDPGVRANAANALASIKAVEAVPQLQSLTTGDTDERVRRDASRAVETIEGGNNCCSCDVPVP